MPTERLFYSDSFLRAFDAKVVAVRPNGDEFHVVLDRTAFYPTGGGQPHDLGRLDEVDVLDVREDEDTGEILHVTRAPVKADRVKGTIDWTRRLDHMQQHSGQHILSAAFVRLCDAPTVGFHLGEELSTIDLRTSLPIPGHLDRVIHEANRILFEDRPVRVMNVTREEAAAMNLRKESDREGILRLIDVEDFDRTPCGGTHVSRTGQVGVILTRKVERYKQGWRVEFVCGGRALVSAKEDFSLLARASQLLSSTFDQIPDLIGKQIDEAKSFRREHLRLLDELAGYQAKELAQEAKTVGSRRLLGRIFSDKEPEFVKLLAQHAAGSPGVVAVFVSTLRKPQILVATATDSAVDAGRLLNSCAQRFPIRGGGSKHLAQGSMEDGSAAASLLEFVEKEIARVED